MTDDAWTLARELVTARWALAYEREGRLGTPGDSAKRTLGDTVTRVVEADVTADVLDAMAQLVCVAALARAQARGAPEASAVRDFWRDLIGVDE